MHNKIDDSIKNVLSESAKLIFDDIDTQRVLGASQHVKMIIEMMKDIIENAQKHDYDVESTKRNLIDLTSYFSSTRGQASQGISNAIAFLVKDVISVNTSLDDLSKLVYNNINSFEQGNKENVDKIISYSLSLLEGMKTVMLFDYSSTVGRMALESRSINHEITYIIPESRALDGGSPYISECINSGHKVHFIPDSAIYHYLKQCDGVFIGAETFYADGRVFNTVGAEMVAYLCYEIGVPFYVLTTLIKIDTRAQFGYLKPPVMQNLFGVIGTDKGIDYSCPELVEIPSKNVTGYITEIGICPAYALYEVSRRFVEGMGMLDE